MFNTQWIKSSFNYNSKTDGEELDAEIEVIRPGLFSQSLKLILDSKKLSLEDFLTELSDAGIAMSTKQLTELLPLEKDFFEKYRTNISNVITFK